MSESQCWAGTSQQMAGAMNFSLRALILACVWGAWFAGALTGVHAFVTESFVACQYLLLAVSASLAIVAGGPSRPFAACFAAGFIAWLLLLGTETEVASMQPFNGTVPGLRIRALSQWIADLRPIEDPRARNLHFWDVTAVVRAAMGTAFGVLTYIVAWFFGLRAAAPNPRAVNRSER